LGFANNSLNAQDFRQPKIMTFELYDPILNKWFELKPESGMSNSLMNEVLKANCTFTTMLNYKSEKYDGNS
jgi:hypothetical protein